MMLYADGQSTTKKSISLETCAGKVPAIMVNLMTPLGMIVSLMKLTKGEVKG